MALPFAAPHIENRDPVTNESFNVHPPTRRAPNPADYRGLDYRLEWNQPNATPAPYTAKLYRHVDSFDVGTYPKGFICRNQWGEGSFRVAYWRGSSRVSAYSSPVVVVFRDRKEIPN